MSIRTKIGIILLSAVICFCFAEYCVQRFVVLPGFVSLEHDEAVKNADRVSKAIENEMDHLTALGWDWSAWDDTYDFVRSRSKEYIQSNLVLSTFTGNRLNLIYILDDKGHVVWGKCYDLTEEKEIALDLFAGDMMPQTHPLRIEHTETDLPEADIKGILMTTAGPIAVSATPILTSNDEGPSRGTLIMGRFLNAEMMRQISEQTQVDVSLTVIEASPVRRPTKTHPSSPYTIQVIDDGYLKVDSVFPDVNGHPAVVLTTNFQRKISQKGYETVHNGILSILIAGFGIFILVVLSLKKTILQPISKLNRHLDAIKHSGDLSKRLNFNRRDEIGSLAEAFDQMVARIEQITIENNKVNKQLRKDIEKRKKAEAALIESEKCFREMVEKAGDAVFLHDHNGNIRLVNHAACEHLGYEKSDLLNLSMYDIDPDAVIRKDKDHFWKNIDYNQSVVFESRHRRTDGSIIPVEVSLTAIQYRGEKLILGISRDIAQRKQMDEKQRHTRKMEAMATLTAGIAHNFNNILSVIIGCTELATVSLSKDHQALKFLKKIEDAGNRAKDIVWQLIHFSQKYEGKLVPVSVSSVLEKEIQRMGSLMTDNIKLISQLESNCYPVVGEPAQLRDLVRNLLQNAVDSMDSGRGVIEVQLENSFVSDTGCAGKIDTSGGRGICLIIRDNGRGIDPSHMERIFDPYFTTKDFSQGAGMGLAVVHGIVVSHGGSITVDSKVGKGTEVRIFFPALEPAVNQQISQAV